MRGGIGVWLIAVGLMACAQSKRYSAHGESCARTDDCAAPLRCVQHECRTASEARALIAARDGRQRRGRAQLATTAGHPEVSKPAAVSDKIGPPTGLEDVPIPTHVDRTIRPAAGGPDTPQRAASTGPAPADLPPN
ncbi:MAG: hypothetical protein VX589_07245 [Myxococcota bacterium]|nr:hypothetical protein [Myxococcota bacterium]